MREEQGCHVEIVEKQPSPEEMAVTQNALFEVWGMGCPNCAQRVKNSLLQQPGLVAANVDHMLGLALVQYNPTMITPDEIARAVEAAGGDGRHEYTARLIPVLQP